MLQDAEGCVRASKLCGKCAELGLESKLRLYQIDMDMAILMCENVDVSFCSLMCVYMVCGALFNV